MMRGPRLVGCQPSLKGRSVLHSSASPCVNHPSAPRPVSPLPSHFSFFILRAYFQSQIRLLLTLFVASLSAIKSNARPPLLFPCSIARVASNDSGSTSPTKWKKSSRAHTQRVCTPPNSSCSRLPEDDLGQSPTPIHSPSRDVSQPVPRRLTSVLSPVSFASLFFISRRPVLFPNSPPTHVTPDSGFRPTTRVKSNTRAFHCHTLLP